MQESVIYQELREEAREEVRQQMGEMRQQLREEVRQQIFQEERLQEARSLILRQLTRKVGEVPIPTRSQIETLSITQLEDLAEALLNFATLADLIEWLG